MSETELFPWQKPVTSIDCPRFEEMWKLVSARCDELLKGARGSSRSAGTISSDGRHMMAIVKAGQDDGTDKVYEVSAIHHDSMHAPERHTPIQVSVSGPYIDSHDSFWLETAEEDKKRTFLVIDGTHYVVSPDCESGFQGHGGRLFRYRMLGEDEVRETRNLWYQGPVPPKFRELFPDNAEFVPIPLRIDLSSLTAGGQQ
jgi:hypothetical protein